MLLLKPFQALLAFLDRLLDWLPGSVVIYATAFAVALTTAAEQIALHGPEGGETVTAWLVRIAAYVTSAAVIWRRVTEVVADLRGLKPIDVITIPADDGVEGFTVLGPTGTPPPG